MRNEEADHAEKEDAICRGCPKFGSKPSGGSSQPGDEEVEDAVDDIADIVFLENGGAATEWDRYPIETYRLYCLWRQTEAEIEENRRRRFDALVKGFLK